MNTEYRVQDVINPSTTYILKYTPRHAYHEAHHQARIARRCGLGFTCIVRDRYNRRRFAAFANGDVQTLL